MKVLRRLLRSSVAGAALLPLLSGLLLAGLPGAAVQAHGAHVHGQGQLQVALDEQTLHLRLRVPGMDVVGFEHAPETDSDRRAVEDAVTRLEDPASVVQLPAEAGCSATGSRVDSPLLGEKGEEHGEEHADFVVEHEFRCDDPAALEHLDVLVGGTLGLERLNVQMISERGEGHTRLQHGNRRVLMP